MKDKIIIFIIGLLVGAIITATCFLLLSKNLTNNSTNFRNDMMQGDMMNMTDDQRMNRRDKQQSENLPQNQIEENV